MAAGGANERDAVLAAGTQRRGTYAGVRTAQPARGGSGGVREVDLPWRFFFATRLSFRPSLPPGIGAFSLLPTVLGAARREFAADLRERGFEAVERGRNRRIHVEADERARLIPYEARFDVGTFEAGITAWLAVWDRGGEFRIAGGAYPTSGLGSVSLEPDRYREELFALICGVR